MNAKAILKKQIDELRDTQRMEKENDNNGKKLSDLIDKIIKTCGQMENDEAERRRTSESIMLAYVIVEKCCESKNKSVNSYFRTDCLQMITAYL